MTFKNFSKMNLELVSTGLMSFQEATALNGSANIQAVRDAVKQDMKNGILFDDNIDPNNMVVDFDDLFLNISEDDKKYYKYLLNNEQPDFLKKTYTKLKEFI